MAYVVGDREHAPTASDLRSFLKDKVPEYMVPSVFMLLDSLPTMPNGKVGPQQRCQSRTERDPKWRRYSWGREMIWNSS